MNRLLMTGVCAVMVLCMNAFSQGAWIQNGDIIVIEFEDGDYEGKNWNFKTNNTGPEHRELKGDGEFRGEGYLQDGGSAGEMVFPIHITDPGTYSLAIRGAQNVQSTWDGANDCFAMMEGQSGWAGSYTKHICWWNWHAPFSNESKGEYATHTFDRPIYNLTEGIHNLKVKGRSAGFMIDQLIIFNMDAVNYDTEIMNLNAEGQQQAGIGISLVSPTRDQVITEGADLPISVTAVSYGQNITSIKISFDGTEIGSSTSGSASATAPALSLGDHTITVVAQDDGGNEETFTRTITARSQNSIFIEAEDYTAMNDIQVQSCDEGGQNVGYIVPGSWMDYDVPVPSTGNYLLRFRVAGEGVGQFNVLQGSNVVGTVETEATGGWQVWETVQIVVALDGNVDELRLSTVTGGYNLNWFEVTPTDEEVSAIRQFAGPASAGLQNASMDVYDLRGKKMGTYTKAQLGSNAALHGMYIVPQQGHTKKLVTIGK